MRIHKSRYEDSCPASLGFNAPDNQPTSINNSNSKISIIKKIDITSAPSGWISIDFSFDSIQFNYNGF